MENGVVLLEEPGQWHEQGGSTDKDVSDRKRAADGFGIVKEEKQRREDEKKPGVGGSISTSRMARYEYAETIYRLQFS